VYVFLRSPEEEKWIREQLEPLRRISGDQIVYGPLDTKANYLAFYLDGRYRGMAWRSKQQHRSRRSLAKGHRSEADVERKLQSKIDKRSERLLSAIDDLCAVLGRPPAHFELRAYLKKSGSTLSEVLCDTGFTWLPMRKRGRK
jgi:hypothetical protein